MKNRTILMVFVIAALSIITLTSFSSSDEAPLPVRFVGDIERVSSYGETFYVLVDSHGQPVQFILRNN